MTRDVANAVLSIAWLAALADGRNDPKEADALTRAADALGAAGADAADAPALLQAAREGRLTLAQAVAPLLSADVPAEARQQAYEIALGVCDADGLRGQSETRFLAELGAALRLDERQVAGPAATADALVTVPLAPADGAAVAGPAAGTGGGPAATAGPGGRPVRASRLSEAETDKVIRDAAVLNGALELLPQSMATLAIIPLQMKLVWKIGEAHGFALDRAQVTDFLGVLGVGLAGQYVEQVGRRLLGGLLGSVFGGMGRAAGSVTAGAALSFATTWAIGQVARRYYAADRTLDTQTLREAFADLLTRGQALRAQLQPQIEEQARNLDPARLLQLVKSR